MVANIFEIPFINTPLILQIKAISSYFCPSGFLS